MQAHRGFSNLSFEFFVSSWFPNAFDRSMRYAELHCKTNFSFLEGASHADELVARGWELGYSALAVTDRNSLAGVVRPSSTVGKTPMNSAITASGRIASTSRGTRSLRLLFCSTSTLP